MNKLFILISCLLLAVTSCKGGVPSGFKPGDIIPESYLESSGPDEFFTVGGIGDDVFALMKGKSYKDDCTVPLSDLRYITVLHRDASGAARLGEMVLAATIADEVLDIFRELFEAGYPIERMLLIDRYDADDETSMRANNSSAFNFRFISHTTTVSRHGLGLAVDINPLYNPYVKTLSDGTLTIEPATAGAYADRSATFPYKIERGDLCHRLFTAHGFTWGGDWKSVKDYQHFEK